ncbi:host cell division inhibitor Icd-like protein (plasmid) [Escherichia coli]|nr:host cell division inhibitor Icd-like protein [Escherichia coli]
MVAQVGLTSSGRFLRLPVLRTPPGLPPIKRFATLVVARPIKRSAYHVQIQICGSRSHRQKSHIHHLSTIASSEREARRQFASRFVPGIVCPYSGARGGCMNQVKMNTVGLLESLDERLAQVYALVSSAHRTVSSCEASILPLRGWKTSADCV